MQTRTRLCFVPNWCGLKLTYYVTIVDLIYIRACWLMTLVSSIYLLYQVCWHWSVSTWLPTSLQERSNLKVLISYVFLWISLPCFFNLFTSSLVACTVCQLRVGDSKAAARPGCPATTSWWRMGLSVFSVTSPPSVRRNQIPSCNGVNCVMRRTLRLGCFRKNCTPFRPLCLSCSND